MLSKVFGIIMTLSFVSAIATGNINRLSLALVNSIADSLSLILTLAFSMCLWSGIINIFQKAGALDVVSKLIKPIICGIFGKKAAKGKCLQNLTSSFAANFLGLGNAAVPFGIKAMRGLNGLEENNGEQDEINGVASDECIMFAVLSTVPFQLLPTTLIALRSKYNSVNPFDVVPLIWLCSAVIILFTVALCKFTAKVSIIKKVK